MEPPAPRAGAVVVKRDVLATGHIVSTVLMAGALRPYESVAFAPGWPDTGDALACLRARYLSEALRHHDALVMRFMPAGVPDPADPAWVQRLLGLPPRRYPRGRPS